MVKKAMQWPRRGEVVIGTVRKVNPFSAFVTLEEYGKKEGMIHISEVAGKWVKDIRKFFKEGKKVVVKVMRVDETKKHITLSLKRVNKYESDRKMKEYQEYQRFMKTALIDAIVALIITDEDSQLSPDEELGLILVSQQLKKDVNTLTEKEMEERLNHLDEERYRIVGIYG